MRVLLRRKKSLIDRSMLSLAFDLFFLFFTISNSFQRLHSHNSYGRVL